MHVILSKCLEKNIIHFEFIPEFYFRVFIYHRITIFNPMITFFKGTSIEHVKNLSKMAKTHIFEPVEEISELNFSVETSRKQTH